MSSPVSRTTRRAIIRRARELCEYCRCPLAFATEPFTVEHIIPVVFGGPSDLDNLALACSGCNGHKYDKIEARDFLTELVVSLYNPRQDRWQDHFAWSEDYSEVIGLTPTGRATIDALRMNRTGIVNLRRALYALGLHPAEER